MLLFVSPAQAVKTPPAMTCGQQVFEITLWKDGIFKLVCVFFVFRVLQRSAMISQA